MLKDASRLLFIWFAALATAFIAVAVLCVVALFLFAWKLGGVTPDNFD